MVPTHERGKLGHDQTGHRLQVLLSLHHPGKFGQVGLEPVLLLVTFGGSPQVVDHLVEVALELVQLAARLYRDRPGQIALGYRGCYIGDRPHLIGKRVRHGVHVVGKSTPGPARSGHFRLPAQLALGTHLLGDAGNLVGKDAQPVHHGVDGVLQFQHLAAHIHGDLLRQVTVGY